MWIDIIIIFNPFYVTLFRMVLLEGESLGHKLPLWLNSGCELILFLFRFILMFSVIVGRDLLLPMIHKTPWVHASTWIRIIDLSIRKQPFSTGLLQVINKQ